ncbi:MAG: hypothetical protein ABIP48_11450 [Planctomycetota bacterium]
MSRFQFELATDDDDRALRELVAESPMPGAVSVTFRREPSFLGAMKVNGPLCQVIVIRDRTTGRIVGLGSRSVRNMFVNGRTQPVGYLGNLRIAKPYRGAGLLARGYAFLRECHAEGPARMYLTTITDENHRAIQLLTSRRAGLPSYHYAGKYHTLVVPLGKRRPRVKNPDPAVSVRPIQPGDVNGLLEFLQAAGPERQFFPDYSADEFFTGEAKFKDLEPSDVLAAYRDGEIVGTLAAWNQRGFRQIAIDGYAGHLRWMRLAVNGWAGLSGRPRLPAPGSELRYVTAAIPVVRGDDPVVFAALLGSLMGRLAAEPHDFLLVGLHEDDPLLPVARAFSASSYRAQLYYVCWDDGEPIRKGLDARVPYMELGCL